MDWHPLIVHFPIVLIPLGVVVDVFALVKGRGEWHVFAYSLTVAGTFLALVSVLTGNMAVESYRAQQDLLEVVLDLGRLPRHVAIIMDGNGRWAARRGLERLYGHRRGKASVKAIVELSRKIGIKYLSLYAFSSENWDRPESEVKGLMNLLKRYATTELDRMMKNGVRLQVIGNQRRLPADVRQALRHSVETTKR